MDGRLIVQGTHRDGQPYEARLVRVVRLTGNGEPLAEPPNDRDQDNSIIVEVRHGPKVYRRKWSGFIWCQAKLSQRLQSLQDRGPGFVRPWP
ncbi:MAG TPA: hypothetical protein VNM37_29540 [Candidatus Dormibacteraeota bacterium]|nr:hypothetical protein [Candidatus Dormibacteraeota bacterium]